MTTKLEHLQTVRQQAVALVEQLHALAAQAPEEQKPLWGEYLDRVQEVAQFLEADGAGPHAKQQRLAMTPKQQREFGRLLRDRRNAAGWSRLQLARKAQLSDATLKFIETARHPPSRASLIRLLNIAELQLSWADVPGQHCPPRATRSQKQNSILPGLTESICGPLWLIPHRLDFDELGDPVFVRRTRTDDPGQLHTLDRELERRPEHSEAQPPRPDRHAEFEYVPLRR